jgi:hypothetical protein
MNDNNNKSKFWHTVDELEPPRNKNVWTTTNPFVSTPTIRISSWGGPGVGWRNHNFFKKVYWAEPISRDKN